MPVFILTLIAATTAGTFMTPSLSAASAFIKVEGVSEKSLNRIQNALITAAYGSDSKTSSRETEVSAQASDDSCDAFYMPPAKFRVIKQLPAVDPCSKIGDGKTSTLIADTDSRTLFLCKEGISVADYDFSMGRYGVGKMTEGDGKTPLGVYPIDAPRGSARFKNFIPVGYPTKSQKQRGYTGSAIGLHGPSRDFRCAGFLNTSVNWTQGCIAVSSDTFIKEIGRFVQENRVREITILPLE